MGYTTQLYSISIIALISLANSFYLDVFTIAKRCAPLASLSETLVSLELIGVKLVIRPVTPVLLVVNRSPSWYVYPFSDICFFLFCSGG
jgi:hypothetical protein